MRHVMQTSGDGCGAASYFVLWMKSLEASAVNAACGVSAHFLPAVRLQVLCRT